MKRRNPLSGHGLRDIGGIGSGIEEPQGLVEYPYRQGIMSNPDRAFWLLAAAVGLGVAYAMWKKPHVLSDVEQTVSGTVSTIFQHTPDVPAVANTDPAQARPGISGATLSF